MSNQKENVIISLGGSIVVPEKINIEFLMKFKYMILKHLPTKRFFIIIGGGRTAREYQNAALVVSSVDDEDRDWLGIHATRLNAHLLRTIFKKHAYKRVLKNPTEKPEFEEDILIAAGWKPGFSTDYDAVLIARNYNAKTIINITNAGFVYDKDPRKFPEAKPLTKISWKSFRKLVGNKWSPSLNMPFDPVASRMAEKLKLKVIITGPDLKNLENILQGRNFTGTIIQ
ncbi:MAG TPA: UMP kinase [archaeon]|nr:UMP kinase [archaeon]